MRSPTPTCSSRRASRRREFMSAVLLAGCRRCEASSASALVRRRQHDRRRDAHAHHLRGDAAADRWCGDGRGVRLTDRASLARELRHAEVIAIIAGSCSLRARYRSSSTCSEPYPYRSLLTSADHQGLYAEAVRRPNTVLVFVFGNTDSFLADMRRSGSRREFYALRRPQDSDVTARRRNRGLVRERAAGASSSRRHHRDSTQQDQNAHSSSAGATSSGCDRRLRSPHGDARAHRAVGGLAPEALLRSCSTRASHDDRGSGRLPRHLKPRVKAVTVANTLRPTT